MSTNRLPVATALCLIWAVVGACDEPLSTFIVPDGGPDTSPLCVPGATQACLCAVGPSSAQSCNQAGSGWLPCECLTPTPDVVVDSSPTPDAVVDTSPTPDAVVDAGPDIVAPRSYYAVYLQDQWDGINCGSADPQRMSPGADIDAVELLAGTIILGNFDVVRGKANPDGNSKCQNAFSDPNAAKGPPDATKNFENYFSLYGGWLVGEFTGALEIQPGDTIRVYELGPTHPLSTEGADEPYEVYLTTGLDCVDAPDPALTCMVGLSAEVVGTATLPVPAF